MERRRDNVKGKMPNMGNIMKQAQQFQSKMAKLQEELGEDRKSVV